MFYLHFDKRELWDESKNEFINIEECDLELEHSLLSVSKWESKYHKPFSSTEKSAEEWLDYFTMMVIDDKKVDRKAFNYLTKNQVEDIMKYIDDPMTATWFAEDYDANGKPKKKDPKKFKGKTMTNELIYYYMTALNIPFECEKWHLSRLTTLIRVCSIESQPKDKKKKMTQSEISARRAQMEARRAKYHTNG